MNACSGGCLNPSGVAARLRPRCWLALAVFGSIVGGSLCLLAQDGMPQLHTNEADLSEVTRSTTLAVDNPLAVFAFVLGQLPDRVTVYPTENYYYFRFTVDGVPYAGNIRLAANDRDRGRVHFAYGERPTTWRPEPDTKHVILDAGRGVAVERLDRLAYRIAHGGKSVVFALNDLTGVSPPAGLLGADETSIGPIYDESGIRFFLVFNARLKLFHYLLDETAPVPDAFFTAKSSDRITVGRRTGFAFYRDDAGRKVLIGVSRREVDLNTMFDGPFDQLPDNFIEGETLRHAIEAVSPEVKGQIDRFGNFAEGGERYLILPYWLYRNIADLTVFHRCAVSRAVKPAEKPRCFVTAVGDSDARSPRPLALKRR
jgi:hypothetical protein